MSGKYKKVREWVSKLGYPLELEVINALRTNRWFIMPSANYFDEDELKWRELDVKAYKRAKIGDVAGFQDSYYQLTFTLIIQCKKSEKFAWVFFPISNEQELHMKVHRLFKGSSCPKFSGWISRICKIFASIRCE